MILFVIQQYSWGVDIFKFIISCNSILKIFRLILSHCLFILYNAYRVYYNNITLTLRILIQKYTYLEVKTTVWQTVTSQYHFSYTMMYHSIQISHIHCKDVLIKTMYSRCLLEVYLLDSFFCLAFNHLWINMKQINSANTFIR